MRIMVDEPRNSEIWKRFDDHASAIAEIRSGQAATSARLENLEQAVDSGFRTLSSELRNLGERVNQPEPPAPYGVYVAIAFGLLTMFGGYSVLITAPIDKLVRQETTANRDDIDRLDNQVTELEAHRQRTARLEAQVATLEDYAKESREFQREAQYIHGQREELGKRVEDIDTYGSRRWNKLDREE